MNIDEPHTITGNAHPDTSHVAAAKIHLHSGTARRRVLETVAANRNGLTDEQIQALLVMPANTQRPRRIELVRAGYLRDSTRRNRTLSGTWSIVWEITDDGRRALMETL